MRGEGANRAVLSIWRDVWQAKRRWWHTPEGDVLDETISPAGLASSLGVMQSVLPRGKGARAESELPRSAWPVVQRLVEIVRDENEVVHIYRGLEKADLLVPAEELDRRYLKLASKLAEGRTDVFESLVLHLSEAHDDHPDTARTGMGHLPGAFGPTRELCDVVLNAPPNDVGRLALLTQLYVTLNGRAAQRFILETRSDSLKWVSDYPDSLCASLRDLGRIHPDASTQAARLCKGFIVDAKQVGREIAALKTRLEDPAISENKTYSLRERLENLKRRQKETSGLSAVQIKKLERKIQRAIRRSRLDAWKEHVLSAIRPSLRAALGESSDEWLSTAERIELISCIAGLSPDFRELGFRALRERSGPKPWDLREEPANRRFLAGLARRGCEVGVWLDKTPTRTIKTASHGEIVIAFTDDPVEILEMGKHFRTCLSPDSFNFFSAVANAVDINKRVLFARDTAGKALGRCLFALDDRGNVLTFHPYSHDTQWDFRKYVRDIARALAKRMGTTCVSRGEVQELVADDWYDDGPVDITGRLAFLADDSSFRKTLADCTQEELRENALRALAPNGIDAYSLPLLLELHELKDRPELTRAFIPELRDDRDVPWYTFLVAIDRLVANDDHHDARDLLLEYVPDRAPIDDDLPVERVTELLLEFDEGERALRLLRISRKRGVRSWGDEPTSRRLLAARALTLLSRPRKALELLETLKPSTYVRELSGELGRWLA